ncbi:MAG: BON domain-containing protein [Leptolyngbyaceae cyanobacterium RM2_2_4]|nr:BON domain-containing protein [Leptolyngbyaceae cyanobacterium SM1_4_3]NJN89985.1 BON domain-containing protein [Leptolyngbyaceae cyanobacterium SL_5_14]NJO51779.1 BON domain-containing protein [Leptolyngbyaceae cyanobacterium RM2_2_4]
MTWTERMIVEEVERGDRPASDRPTHYEAQMSPGITGKYDHKLREKAGMHTPPPLPENMGVEGEFDLGGLAKRVAIALDHSPVASVESLQIVQQGNLIQFRGSSPNQSVLEQIVKITAQVDGVRYIEIDQVAIAP